MTMKIFRYSKKSRKIMFALIFSWILFNIFPVTSSAEKAGSYATYLWTSDVPNTQQVIYKTIEPTGKITYRVKEEPVDKKTTLYVKYSIAAKTSEGYWLQIVTSADKDSEPLNITQILINAKTGASIRSKIVGSKGVLDTPENELKPISEKQIKDGKQESVRVPAGTFTAISGEFQGMKVWLNKDIPATGIVKAILPRGILELVDKGDSGAVDLIRKK